MYSPNGTGWRFTYCSPGPVVGLHTMPMLRDVVRAWSVHHGTDQDGHADRPDRIVDLVVRRSVVVRVDVGRVLRPDHQVGLRPLAGVDLRGEVDGRLRVVVEHGPALGERVHPLAWDVALHRGDLVVPSAPAMPDGQHQAPPTVSAARPPRCRGRAAGGRDARPRRDDQPRPAATDEGDQQRCRRPGRQRSRAGCRPAPKARLPHGQPAEGDDARRTPRPTQHQGERARASQRSRSQPGPARPPSGRRRAPPGLRARPRRRGPMTVIHGISGSMKPHAEAEALHQNPARPRRSLTASISPATAERHQPGRSNGGKAKPHGQPGTVEPVDR